MFLLAQRFDKKWDFLGGAQFRQIKNGIFWGVRNFDVASRWNFWGPLISDTRFEESEQSERDAVLAAAFAQPPGMLCSSAIAR